MNYYRQLDSGPEYVQRIVRDRENRCKDRKLQSRVLVEIPTGESNAISLKDLARKTDVSERDVRQIVQDLRDHNEIILSNTHGYYRHSSIEELERYYDATRGTALTYLRRLKPVRLEIKRVREGQEDADNTLLPTL